MIVENAPDLEVVGEAGDGAEAATMAVEVQPDVVLMDVTDNLDTQGFQG